MKKMLSFILVLPGLFWAGSGLAAVKLHNRQHAVVALQYQVQHKLKSGRVRVDTHIVAPLPASTTLPQVLQPGDLTATLSLKKIKVRLEPQQPWNLLPANSACVLHLSEHKPNAALVFVQHLSKHRLSVQCYALS